MNCVIEPLEFDSSHNITSLIHNKQPNPPYAMDDEPPYSETTLSLKLSYCDSNPPRQLIFEGCSSVARPDEPALSLGLPEPSSTSSRRPLGSGVLRIKREKEAGDEEEEEEEEGARGARKKLRLSKEQAALLEDMFKEHSTLNSKQKHALARQLKLLPRQVEVWFQNRRARTKLKKTQVEREILRKCCDALREENKRLRKELHELKSINCSATQLMMICSSCQKVIHDGGNSNGTSGSASGEVAKPRFFNPFAHSTKC